MNDANIQAAGEGGRCPEFDTPLPWRPDVEGLRGLAVLAVMVFHGVPAWLPGGFAGVDIFFVLSGFVVGRVVLADLDRQCFAYREFYARRVRRIFPALILVVAATLAAAPAFLGGDDLRALGLQAAAAMLFVPNVLAWLQSGYFDGDAAYRPLLHLWSLGVEEQFYVFLPVILALLWQRHRASLGGALALLAGLSFCACVVATLHDASAAFYLPFFRFWELLAGTWLAWQERAPWRPSPAVSAAAAGLGLALLLGALTWLAEGRDFPGWRAVFPAVGTLLVLAAGPRAAPNRWVFSGGGVAVARADQLCGLPVALAGVRLRSLSLRRPTAAGNGGSAHACCGRAGQCLDSMGRESDSLRTVALAAGTAPTVLDRRPCVRAAGECRPAVPAGRVRSAGAEVLRELCRTRPRRVA
jgi:peptidoglycan/LPS O-acetylase OafA/YrhL